jgi:hypothetical protein
VPRSRLLRYTCVAAKGPLALDHDRSVRPRSESRPTGPCCWRRVRWQRRRRLARARGRATAQVNASDRHDGQQRRINDPAITAVFAPSATEALVALDARGARSRKARAVARYSSSRSAPQTAFACLWSTSWVSSGPTGAEPAAVRSAPDIELARPARDRDFHERPARHTCSASRNWHSLILKCGCGDSAAGGADRRSVRAVRGIVGRSPACRHGVDLSCCLWLVRPPDTRSALGSSPLNRGGG